MLRAGAAALAASGVLVLVGPAVAKRPPVLRVLNSGWFQVSARGTYSMHWAANADGSCPIGGSQFLHAQSSESLRFQTRRSVRTFVAETLIPGIGKGPRIPTLVLAR